ncbi:hypothetical protein KA005_53215 [bacterium]|nr:hypothetical protein [bacterium]
MISGKKFNEGLKWLKENYNLKDFSPVTTKVWFEILKTESITDKQYERCIRIIIKTIPNWYQAGESLASRVLSVLPQARRELRSEREYIEATTPPKELPMSEEEKLDNIKSIGSTLRRLREKLAEPRRSGESVKEKQDRIQRELDEEFSPKQLTGNTLPDYRILKARKPELT